MHSFINKPFLTISQILESDMILSRLWKQFLILPALNFESCCSKKPILGLVFTFNVVVLDGPAKFFKKKFIIEIMQYVEKL